jgi:DNA-binding transcriptional ArsR family regulator
LALALREEDGDLLGVAKSHGNLGLLYRAHGDYDHAIAAYTEAMTTYVRLGNQELAAVAQLNIGAAHFLAGNVDEAVRRYQASLEISRTLGLPLLEIKAHYNLAEAYAATGATAIAGEHWQLGVAVCRRYGFDDQEKDFRELAATLHLPIAALHAAAPTYAQPPDVLAPDEAAVLALAQREQRLTAQRLVEALHVSRATATRRLAALRETGFLQMEGPGRGVHYRLASAAASAAVEAPASNLDLGARTGGCRDRHSRIPGEAGLQFNHVLRGIVGRASWPALCLRLGRASPRLQSVPRPQLPHRRPEPGLPDRPRRRSVAHAPHHMDHRP